MLHKKIDSVLLSIEIYISTFIYINTYIHYRIIYFISYPYVQTFYH